MKVGQVTQIPSEEYGGDATGGFTETYDSPSGETTVSESGYGQSGGPGDFKQGGLAKKKVKPKKMKRGGLASKK